MPYIKNKEHRKECDEIVELMDDYLSLDGDLNYVLFKFAKGMPSEYKLYRNLIGELNECVAEIRRRLLAPYEDKKIKENGDV